MKKQKKINRLADSEFAAEAADFTTAMVGIGHVGARYATNIVLQFQAELAVAHDAVSEELPAAWAVDNGFMPIHTQVTDHKEYLLRPDLGRRLDNDSLQRVKSEAESGVDVQIIVADGLSAVACQKTGKEIFTFLHRECKRLDLTVGTPMAAKYARVWLQDEIGELVKAKVAIIILGERPGLGTGDGLSAYVVYEPKIGKTDGDRNMISNIHSRGIKPDEAAQRLAQLTMAMLEQKRSGVSLNLSGITSEGILADSGYREPERRLPLVELD